MYDECDAGLAVNERLLDDITDDDMVPRIHLIGHEVDDDELIYVYDEIHYIIGE